MDTFDDTGTSPKGPSTQLQRRVEARGYTGPDRRAHALRQEPWTQVMLDELGHGVLLIGPDEQVMLMNHAAKAEMNVDHPLLVLARELRASEPHDVAPLAQAMAAARLQGLRKLISVGSGPHRVVLAIVPLGVGAHAGPYACMVSLGKRHMCERLSLQGFVQLHHLTLAEARVLEGLCEGDSPRVIADHQGVGMATVRTQIGCIRTKTGARDIRELIQQVVLFPPMVSSLRPQVQAQMQAQTQAPTQAPAKHQGQQLGQQQVRPLPWADADHQARAA